jgi:hypothetical protein
LNYHQPNSGPAWWEILAVNVVPADAGKQPAATTPSFPASVSSADDDGARNDEDAAAAHPSRQRNAEG